MKIKLIKAIATAATISMVATIPVFAAGNMGGFQNQMGGQMQMGQMFGGQMSGGQMGGAQFGGKQGNVTYASEPSEIVTSDVVNTASSLSVDYSNAETITISDSENEVKISEAGTYIVTGTCSDGNITVKKGVTGVVLVLKDLDLTSKAGAAVSCNKGSEVKIVIDGNVKLTDAEDPADEDSTDAEVADAFDGAALKVKDGANVCLTGDGTLTIDASSCKNGIKIGDADTPSFVIDGDLTLNITAANDAINGGYDVTILNGTLNITAGDDAIHADRILTIGSEDGDAPVINIKNCNEGLEGTVVNLFGGKGTVNVSDDAVNAANSDGTYASEMSYSINVTGGDWTIKCTGDGLDSNGNINITGGTVSITSGTTGGEAGLDYIGSCYVAEGTLTNNSGVSGPDMMGGGMMGGFGQMQQGGRSQMQNGGKEASTTTETEESEETADTDEATQPSTNQNRTAGNQMPGGPQGQIPGNQNFSGQMQQGGRTQGFGSQMPGGQMNGGQMQGPGMQGGFRK